MKLEKITINRKHEMFWNYKSLNSDFKAPKLTVNMKCFEIKLEALGFETYKN